MTIPVRTTAHALLLAEEIEALRQYTTPTIANAIEVLGVTPQQAVYTNAGIRCLFPELGPIVGYACTATIFSGQPAPKSRRVSRTDYWRYTQSVPGPRVTVMQDLSEQPGGAYWGEVNANLHRALGVLGVITNGTVRDIDEISRTGLHVFSSGVQVSHGLAHLEDFERPVRVFDMLVSPGDLIHADRHGAVVIPREIAHEVTETAEKIVRAETLVIELCQSPHFSIEELDKHIPDTY